MLEELEGKKIVSIAKIDERQGYSILLDSGELLLIISEKVELKAVQTDIGPQ